MFEVALRAAVILAIAWVVTRLLWRATPATRHLAWHCAIVAVLAAPVLAPLTPSWHVPLPQAVVDHEWLRSSPTPRIALPDSAPVVSSTPATPSTAGTLGTPGTLETPGPFRTPGLLGILWLAGSLVVGLWFALGWVSSALVSRRAHPAPVGWQDEIDALRARLHITRRVRLAIVDGHSSPLAVGVWRASILLPTQAAAWDADRRRAVLLHELAHIRRRDCGVQALAQAACTLYWFNPLAWMAAGRLRSERERACDDEVLESGAQPSSYAAHLLEIARDLRPAPRPSAALAMARPSDLEGRLLSVLAAGRARVPARGSRAAVAATLALATVAALGASPSSARRAIPEAPTVPSAVREPYLTGYGAPVVPERIVAERTINAAAATLQSSADPEARARAAVDLAQAGDPDGIRPLRAALADGDADVREKAAIGLALLSGPQVIPALLEALADADAQVREKAAIGLALRRDPRVVDALLKAMNDPDAQVREKVAIALGTSADARATAALEKALSDPDPQVREKAVAGLVLLRLARLTQ